MRGRVFHDVASFPSVSDGGVRRRINARRIDVATRLLVTLFIRAAPVSRRQEEEPTGGRTTGWRDDCATAARRREMKNDNANAAAREATLYVIALHGAVVVKADINRVRSVAT